eukprot:5002389-Prymnesium_polylepis.1
MSGLSPSHSGRLGAPDARGTQGDGSCAPSLCPDVSCTSSTVPPPRCLMIVIARKMRVTHARATARS